MDKNELFEKLNENLENLDNVDKEIGMIELAIYQKTIEQLKNNKINEIRNFFEQQAKIYNQNSKKYEKEIENNIKKYEEQIEKLVNVYDELYINIFKIMQNAKDNEKIAIANIVTLSDRLQKEKNIEQQLQKNIIACIQKKLNYSVIIDECKARIEWCIENVKEDINQIFIIEANQLQLYKENIVSKIRRIIFNKISGKSKYKRFLENYQSEYLKDIKSKNNIKIIDILIVLKGIKKQMEETKKQISKKYKEMLYA